VARHGESADRFPDWDLLPTPILRTIIQKAFSKRPFPHAGALVCKRWGEVARDVQGVFHPSRGAQTDRGAALVRGIRQFPHLTSVSLTGHDATDFVLGAVASWCPQITHLSLSRAPDLSSSTLGNLFRTLTDLKSLTFSSMCPLPESVSCLQRLESLYVTGLAGPLPVGLGALFSLSNLSLAGNANHYHSS